MNLKIKGIFHTTFFSFCLDFSFLLSGEKNVVWSMCESERNINTRLLLEGKFFERAFDIYAIGRALRWFLRIDFQTSFEIFCGFFIKKNFCFNKQELEKLKFRSAWASGKFIWLNSNIKLFILLFGLTKNLRFGSLNYPFIGLATYVIEKLHLKTVSTIIFFFSQKPPQN